MKDDTDIRVSLTIVVIHPVVSTLLITRILPLLPSLPSHPHTSILPLHQLHTPTVALHYTSLESNKCSCHSVQEKEPAQCYVKVCYSLVSRPLLFSS